MCYVLARQGDDPAILINQLQKFFDKSVIARILKDKTIRGLKKATENYVKQTLSAVGGGGEDSSSSVDEETTFLKHCSHNLSYSDVPGLRVIDERRTMTNVSILWIRDKIRRMFNKPQLPLLDSFLKRITDMFGSGVQAVFDAEFRREVRNELLPNYTGEKPRSIDEWLNVASYDETIFAESSSSRTFFTNNAGESTVSYETNAKFFETEHGATMDDEPEEVYEPEEDFANDSPPFEEEQWNYASQPFVGNSGRPPMPRRTTLFPTPVSRPPIPLFRPSPHFYRNVPDARPLLPTPPPPPFAVPSFRFAQRNNFIRQLFPRPFF